MITGIDIKNVVAKRELNEAISNMKFNINFESVKVSQDSVDVAFTFTATYEGGTANKPSRVGEIRIEGSILSKENKKDSEEIENSWKSKKTLPIKFAEDVINLLNFECGARGTLVAYSIGFAAPLPISRARLQETPTNAS